LLHTTAKSFLAPVERVAFTVAGSANCSKAVPCFTVMLLGFVTDTTELSALFDEVAKF